MKTQKKILTAFLLNLGFCVLEFFGGIYTGSFAVLSDAVHDLGDAAAIGLSYFLERKSRKAPDDSHTYGYVRYSVAGGFITAIILLSGSAMVLIKAVKRLIEPGDINAEGMVAFALVGTVVNSVAAVVTSKGESVNQKTVNLHMLEDVMGWLSVLVGGIIIRLTGFEFIDPLMSVGISVFIIIGAVRSIKQVVDIFLEKTPEGICTDEIRQQLEEIDGVKEVHHIHIRSLDGYRNYCTMHIVLQGDPAEIKEKVRHSLRKWNIVHCTLETHRPEEECKAKLCTVEGCHQGHHHHHHHH